MSAAGCTGRECRRIPRSVPDEEFNQIFARLPSHRDRALVAFYVSTGARASELLSATLAGVDPGRQVITVIRKGTCELQELPASSDAFVWLRLYQVEMAGLIPAGRRQPLWWTLRRPVRPLTYHAVHRMFERANRQGRTGATLHSLRHTAAYRMAEDPALPLTDVQFVLGHAQLTTTQIFPQGRRDPPGPGPSRRAGPAGRGPRASGGGSRLPARDDGGAVRGPDAVTEVITFPGVSSRPSRARRESARTRFPPRPVATDWPATRQERGAVQERLTSARSSSCPTPTARTNADAGCHGCWTGWPIRRARPGSSAGWPATPMPRAVPGGRCQAAWQHERGRDVRWLRVELSGALVVAICGDRGPSSLSCLVAGAAGRARLARNLARTRDPAGFARAWPAVRRATARDRRQPPAVTLRRIALIMAAKGGMLADITVGDCAGTAGRASRRACSRPRPRTTRSSTRCCASWGSSETRRPRRLRDVPQPRASSRQASCRPLRAALPSGS